MQIHIEIHVRSESGGGILFFSNPYVKMKNYKVDPDKEAARWAYVRIRETELQMSRSLEIEKVIYNGDRNITEETKLCREEFDLSEWRQEGYIQ
ncbi:hypothetical protein [Bacillus sp. FJAT-49736]|uniref:hypothetical protein n=1 Tax=Bacillus sp. FJAT-49736 TaxID=2833582 RepID=UPI001BC9F85D|nr:hypothetical protein [Bacillus sp. FJAT-49736]MBS4173462.1 hypothetical protein [Bacillus sp. FJAT-49736]